MAELNPPQHAQLGCEYLDELLHALQSSRWCFHDTYGIERKISEHAEALGIATPLDRPSKPEHETAQELQIWLKMHDPLTDTPHERLISSMIFAPPPASKGTVLKTTYRPLDEREQAEFLQFAERLKREFQRRGQLAGNGQAPAAPAKNLTANSAANLTPAQHAELGCEYLDELLQDLETHDWCWMGALRGTGYERMGHSVSGIGFRFNEHAQALGLPLVFDGEVKKISDEQTDFWLKTVDPVKGGQSSTLTATMHQPKGRSHTITPYPFDTARQREFREFVERLKREIQRRAKHGGAGNGFAAALESDAKTKAAWERARAKLQAYGEAMRAANAGNADDLRRKLDEMADAMRDGLRASGDELAAQDFTPPATIEDWEDLARIVEIPLETIRSGNLTAREIHACALAWADRQKISGKLSASTNAPTSTKSGATYTVAAVLEMAGVSDTTLNRYAKLAGIKTPERGKRNHRYTADEVRAMLQAIIDNTSERAMKERCRQALTQL